MRPWPLGRAAVSTGLLVWLWFSVDRHAILASLKTSDPRPVLGAFLAVQLAAAASTVKWFFLVRDRPARVTLGKLFRLYYIGLFFNNFFPGSLGGDVARVLYLGRQTGVPKAAASVVLERLTGGLALVGILLATAGSLPGFRPYLSSILPLAGLLVAALLGVLFYQARPRTTDPEPTPTPGRTLASVGRLVGSLGRELTHYRGLGWRWWTGVALLSLAFQGALVGINGLLLRSFQVSLPWLELSATVCLISALTMLPLGINGLGIRETGYIFLFQRLGVAGETALSVSLLFFLLVLISSLAGGVFWLLERGGERLAAVGQPVAGVGG